MWYIPISPLHFKHFFSYGLCDPKLKESKMNGWQWAKAICKGKKRRREWLLWIMKGKTSWEHCILPLDAQHIHSPKCMCAVCVCVCLFVYLIISNGDTLLVRIGIRMNKNAALKIVHIILLYLIRSSFFFSLCFYLLFAIILLFVPLVSHSSAPLLFLTFHH